MRRIRLGLLASIVALMVAVTAWTGRATHVRAFVIPPVAATLYGSFNTTTTFITFIPQTHTTATSGYQIRTDIPDLRTVNFNDKAIGLTVSIPTAIAAYADINYQGTCETFFGKRYYDLTGTMLGQNSISSVRLNYTCLGPTTGKPVVQDLTVADAASGMPSCPQNYNRFPQNLNDGAGGDSLYLCIEFGPSTINNYVSDVRVIGPYTNATCCDPDFAPVSLACESPDQLINVDLNKGVTGYAYVYLCVSKNGGRSGTQLRLRDIGAKALKASVGSSNSLDTYCQDTLQAPAGSASSEHEDMNDFGFSVHPPSLNIFLCKSTYDGPDSATSLGPTETLIQVAAVLVGPGCRIFCLPTTVAPGSTVTAPGTVSVRWTCSGSGTANPAKTDITTNGVYHLNSGCTDGFGNHTTSTFSFTRNVP